MIDQMSREVKGLLKSAVEISYFSRAGIPYETVLNMTAIERDIAIEFINDRLKAAAKMPFPVF